MIDVEIKIVNDIPKEQIGRLEDRVIYNTAALTREYTKGASAYPYLSGELSRQEIQAPIEGSNKEYGLLGGVDYAKYVWNMTNVKWSNPSTKPQWYYSVLREKEAIIVNNALNKALKEI